jgi:tetratricopeptide (TPR) repeat protein
MLEQAIEVNPNYVELHYDIGYAQSYSGQFEQAEINLQKSLGHFPQRKETMVLMVYNYFSWGKYDKALKVIKQLLLLNQNDIKSWHTRGVIEFMAGRRSEARQSWEKALQIEPENQDLMELIRRFDRGKLTKEMLLVK